jgi:RNA polymerase sigma-70 factor (ECF subfamily)
MTLSTRDHPSPHSPTDGELVALAQKGEQQAFEKLYERYYHRIHVYISRMVGNDEVGYELVQETFLKAWEDLLRLRNLSSFASWLYRIATNITCDYQRRESKFHWLPWEEHKKKSEIMEEISTVGSEKRIEELEIIRQALSRVHGTYRACLILYDVEGLSQREVAQTLGIKESCVSKYISRGKEQFRQIYHRLIEEHAN